MSDEIKKLEESIIHSKVENLVAAREVKLFHSFINFRIEMMDLEMKFLKDAKKILSENLEMLKEAAKEKQ